MRTCVRVDRSRNTHPLVARIRRATRAGSRAGAGDVRAGAAFVEQGADRNRTGVHGFAGPASGPAWLYTVLAVSLSCAPLRSGARSGTRPGTRPRTPRVARRRPRPVACGAGTAAWSSSAGAPRRTGRRGVATAQRRRDRKGRRLRRMRVNPGPARPSRRRTGRGRPGRAREPSSRSAPPGTGGSRAICGEPVPAVPPPGSDDRDLSPVGFAYRGAL